MYYVNNEKHSNIALVICCLLALCSPSYNKTVTIPEVVQSVEAKSISVETKTGKTNGTGSTIQKAKTNGKKIEVKTPIIKNIGNGNENHLNIKAIVNAPVKKSVEVVKDSIQTSSVILRKGWNDPRVQYAWTKYKDMDFIKTIEAESKWDINAIGDKGRSFGLCQIHKWYNPDMQKTYRSLKTDNEKIDMCYAQYKNWVDRGVIKTRLYGYNVRNKPQNKNSFTFK